MQSYIGCIYLTFLHCAFSNVSSNCLHEKGHSHIVRFPNRLAFFQVTLGPCLSWLHLLDFSPLCIFKCHFKLPACVDAKSHWLHLFDFSPLCIFNCTLKPLRTSTFASFKLELSISRVFSTSTMSILLYFAQ